MAPHAGNSWSLVSLFILRNAVSLYTKNLFFMKIPWKCVEKPMNFFSRPWKRRFRILWRQITSLNFHEILYQLFSWTIKSLQSHEYGFSWVMKVSYILDWYISWPLKRQLQPSMHFMGDEISNSPWNSHEGTIKNPWKCPTHSSTKVDINALEKCCTHLLIRNSSC